MTTIAAVQGRDWAVLAYDSQVTEDNGRSYVLASDNGKVCENGPYLMGAAGDLRAVNILSHNFHPPDPAEHSGIDLDKFMATKFVPAMKKCFDINFYGKDNEHGSLIMVVVNAVIYEVGGAYDIVRDETGLYALGTGSPYALGAMYQFDADNSRTMKNARTMSKSGVEIACRLDPASSGPVHMKIQRWS